MLNTASNTILIKQWLHLDLTLHVKLLATLPNRVREHITYLYEQQALTSEPNIYQFNVPQLALSRQAVAMHE